MVNPLFGKLFGSMVERRINSWVEKEGKRAKGHAGFRPRHSTIDHCITLKNFIEKVWDIHGEESFCCFVDFKKVFDIVPRDKLWRRMEEIKIPSEYRVAIHKLYEKVRAKIRTKVFLNALVLTLGSSRGVIFPPLCLAYVLIRWKNG